MASLPSDLDPNDPINILLMPFDPIPKAAATTSGADPDAEALADAQASQAALDAAAEAETQRKLAEEKANILRSTVGGKGNVTQFGGAEGEVVYESNVRPSGRRWEPSNRVETKRTVVDFNMSDPLPPSQFVSENASFSPTSSPVSFSQPIQVEVAAPVAASRPPVKAAVTRASPQPVRAAVARASPQPVRAAVARASPIRAAPAAPAAASTGGAAPDVPADFSPTAGVHPTTNKTEELMKKVGGNAKVRQCPSFRMLEFQIQYEDYKLSKTAVS